MCQGYGIGIGVEGVEWGVDGDRPGGGEMGKVAMTLRLSKEGGEEGVLAFGALAVSEMQTQLS